MKKRTGSLFLSFILTLFACRIELPSGVFDSLDSGEVLSALAYLDEGAREGASLPLSLTLPDGVRTMVSSYDWEIVNWFGHTVFTSEKEGPVVSGLTAEEYTVFITISDGAEPPSSRVFEKTFIVWKPDELSSLALLGLTAECDSGAYNNDNVTNITSDLNFNAQIAEDYLNKALKLNWIVRNDTSENGSVDVPPSAAGEFVVSVGKGKTFEDGVYEFYLEDPTNEEAVGNRVQVTVDTTAPVLAWKIADEEVQTEWAFNEGESDLTSYAAVSSDSILETVRYETNIPGFNEMTVKQFRCDCAGAQQIVGYQGSDLAGNLSNALSRTVTVKDPPQPKAIEDPSFEEGGAGLDGEGNWDESKGKLSTAWSADVKTFVTKGAWTGTASSFGQGPFRYYDEGTKFEGKAYAGVKAAETKSGSNSFWFCGTFDAGYDIWPPGNCWYSNSSGSLYQEGFDLQKNVTYTASVWVKSNNNTIPADKNVKICFAVLAFNENGSLNRSGVEILASAYTTDAAFTDYEQVSVGYTPAENQTVAVFIEKDDRGESDDNWVHLDDVGLTAQWLKVSQELLKFSEE